MTVQTQFESTGVEEEKWILASDKRKERSLPQRRYHRLARRNVALTSDRTEIFQI